MFVVKNDNGVRGVTGDGDNRRGRHNLRGGRKRQEKPIRLGTTELEATGEAPPIVIVGDLGCGKSALMANLPTIRAATTRHIIFTSLFVGALGHGPSVIEVVTELVHIVRHALSKIGTTLNSLPEGWELDPAVETPGEVFSKLLEDAGVAVRSKGKKLCVGLDGLDLVVDDATRPLSWPPRPASRACPSLLVARRSVR